MANLFIIFIALFINIPNNLNNLSYFNNNSPNKENAKLIVNKIDFDKVKLPLLYRISNENEIKKEYLSKLENIENDEESGTNILFGSILLIILIVGTFYLWRYEPFNKEIKR